ncbi:MAG: response regulator [Candidatus Lokiarchaeota archaeon]|nr:response regulator [Candidatus Lokiarchaeota archaeon]MBD3341064.1 response regulator [Candidatus Lokiarchaeota archaeon]
MTNKNSKKGKTEEKNMTSEEKDVVDTDIDIQYNDDGQIIKTPEMKEYEEKTGKYAIWRGVITEGFKRWKAGEHVYDRDKERVSLYVSEDSKKDWLEFIEKNNYSTISKLIRDSVKYFIEKQSAMKGEELLRTDIQKISNISHALKEPLTTIKGFSQLLLENYKEELNEEVQETVQNIFNQSILLEKKIVNILDDIKVEEIQYDILLIEDDLPTIRLITSYFESKGYKCKGVISGTKGIEELKASTPKIILLDIILPDLSGYDLCKIIKSDEKYKDIPVYFLTAIPASEVEKRLEDTKADGFILKPFDFSDFELIFENL